MDDGWIQEEWPSITDAAPPPPPPADVPVLPLSPPPPSQAELTAERKKSMDTAIALERESWPDRIKATVDSACQARFVSWWQDNRPGSALSVFVNQEQDKPAPLVNISAKSPEAGGRCLMALLLHLHDHADPKLGSLSAFKMPEDVTECSSDITFRSFQGMPRSYTM